MTDTSVVISPVGQLRVYACGGTGINIAKKISDYPIDGFAVVNRCFIDTSRTNMDEHTPADLAFVVPRSSDASHRSEGSGKNRSTNEQAIYDSIPAIMSKFPPQDVNVVVFSGSGGTGSVAGPFIMDYLLETGANAIAVMIGTEESARAASNTFGTLKTLEGFVETHQRPVVVNYHYQKRTDTRESVDDMALAAIASLAVLVSRNNDELDLEDIHNLLDYTEVTDVAEQLTLMEIYADVDQLEAEFSGKPVIGLGAVLGNKNKPLPNLEYLYDAIGYYNPPHADNARDVFFVVTTTGMDDILATMLANETKAEAMLHAQSPSARFATGSANKRTGRTKASTTGLLR